MRRLWEQKKGRSERPENTAPSPTYLNSPFLSIPPSYAVSSFPEGIALGDFNGDGKLDVVAAANPPQILLGNGDGTLQAAVPIGTIAATDVAVGDFNLDGKLDVAFAMQGGVVVYLGNGDGTFGAGTSFSSGGTTQNSTPQILVADVNNDGFLDLILNTDAGVSVLLGKGNGTFGAARTSAVSGGVSSMTVADFNKDGRPDLAILAATASDLSILLGKGNGIFTVANTYPLLEPVGRTGFNGIGNPDSAIASADFNQDGNADVAIAGQVFLGNGDGSLRAPISFDTFPGASVIAAVDLNGDGFPDLATQSYGFQLGDYGTVGVSLGNGDGTFQPVRVFNAGGEGFLSFLATGDLNGDGTADIVLGSSDSVDVLLNRGDGTFPSAELDIGGGSGTLAVGDFNQDGNPDVALSDGSVYLGNGSGRLQFLASANLGGIAVETSDFNHDGKLDLAAAVECAPAGCSGGGQLVISLGNGDGTFQPPTALPSGGFYAESLVIADFNNDGNPDIAIVNNCVDVNCSSPSGSLSIFLGSANGTFNLAGNIVLNQSTAPYPVVVVAGDFNNDGQVDLAALAPIEGLFEPAIVYVLLGSGNGTFQSPIIVETTSSDGVTAAVVGDFNQDGILDLALADGDACSDCDGHGSIIYGVGDGTFATGHDLGTQGGPPVSIVAADFYGTGSPTPVLANRCGDYLDCPNGSVMIDGTQDISDIMLLNLGVGDFNNDGKPDLVGSLQYDAGVSVLLNVGATLAATTTTISPSAPQSLPPSQPITFTVQLSNTGPGTPRGTVSFNDNGVLIGSVSVVKGQASFTTSQLAIGSHFIVAYYGGDYSFAPSNSLGVHVTVTRATSTTSLTSSPNPARPNQAVTYTATVTSQFGVVTGNVVFKDGNQFTTVPVTEGVAVLTKSYPAPGSHSVTATYSGDKNNTRSSGTTKEFVANIPVPSKTRVTTSGSPSLINQLVTFTATVTSIYGPIPNGDTVTFFDGTTVIGTGVIANEVATFGTSSLSAGTHAIKAEYMGDGAFKASSAIVKQVVDLYPSTTSLTSSPNPSSHGQPVTLVATVSSEAPTEVVGTVTFKNGTATLGTITLSGGTATLTTTKLPVGTLTITATYNGDAQSAKSSGTITQIVN